ncbi:MAG: hypothetical protein IPJ41_18095 [Phycisphaerales bacterium]|nr:hypothetical protein [Phycisphaerales bacterium]
MASKAAVLIELKARLGTELWARLEACKAYLSEKGKWSPEKEPRVASLWAWCVERRGGTPSKETHSLWVVSALAIGEGAEGLPRLEEVKKRWRDLEYRRHLMNLHLLVTGQQDVSDFTEDDEGEFGSGGVRFCKRYERILGSLEEYGIRPGTVIDPRKHRDGRRSDE